MRRTARLRLRLVIANKRLSPRRKLACHYVRRSKCSVSTGISVLLSSSYTSNVTGSVKVYDVKVDSTFLRLRPSVVIILNSECRLLPVINATLIVHVPVTRVSKNSVARKTVSGRIHGTIAVVSALRFPNARASTTHVNEVVKAVGGIFIMNRAGLSGFLHLSLLSEGRLTRSLGVSLNGG